MPNDSTRVENTTGRERRRRYMAKEKLALVDAIMQPGMTVSAFARLNGVSASLLFKWRQLMSQGGQVAVKADEDVVAASRARERRRQLPDGLFFPSSGKRLLAHFDFHRLAAQQALELPHTLLKLPDASR